MERQARGAETRVLSVRLPVEEAEKVDQLAAANGLTRNDYIRMRLITDAGEVDELEESVRTNRRLNQLCSRYLGNLDDVDLAAGEGEAARARLEEELAQAETLIDLTSKTQRHVLQILRKISEKLLGR